MCRQLPPRMNEISDEEVGDAEEDSIDHEEENEDAIEMESLQQQEEDLRFAPILMTAFLEYTSYHDLEKEKGLEHLNVVLDFLGEEKVVDAVWWQLASGQKKEVFEALLSVDFVKEFEQEEKSEES